MVSLEQLTVALARRKPFEPSGQMTQRLFDGFADGDPQVLIDRYQTSPGTGFAIAHFFPLDDKSTGDIDQLYRVLLQAREPLGVQTLILKNHPHDAQKHKEERAIVVFGEPLPDAIVAQEGEFSFELRPEGTLFAGIYPDTYFLRRRIQQIQASKVINAFCFSGALGVVSARSDIPQEILQVDSSPAALAWAQRNWELNQQRYPQAEMRFLCDECINFFTREVRRISNGAARSDLIILDPPSFGRGRKKVFSLKKDVHELLSLALQCLAPEGRCIFTANFRQWSPQKMVDMVQEAAAELGIVIEVLEHLRPPSDEFPSREPHSVAVRGVMVQRR